MMCFGGNGDGGDDCDVTAWRQTVTSCVLICEEISKHNESGESHSKYTISWVPELKYSPKLYFADNTVYFTKIDKIQ